MKLPFETTPSRTLFSAMGVLVGSGVVAVAFASPEAQARSALDDMAWAPQQSQLTQSAAAADGGTAGAVALSRAMTPGGGQGAATAYAVPVPVAVSVASAAPVAFEREVEPQRFRGFADAGAQPVAVAVPVQPQPLRGFADAGAAVAAVASNADAQRIGVATSPIRASVPSRMPNIQAELQSPRGGVASVNGSLLPPGAVDSSAHRALSGQPMLDDSSASLTGSAVPLARRSQRSVRASDQGYSDWLDDGSASRAGRDQAVVPEQAVRAALRNAADAAAARSPAVRQARNDWEAAKFDVDQVKGQRYPQVQVGANTPSITGDSASFNQYNRPTASVAITTLLYDFGKTSKNIDSRKKTADAAEFYYETIAQQNAYEVSSNLVDLAKYRAIYTIGESYVKRMSQLVDMLGEIVKVDPGRLSELTQAKSRLLQAQTSQETVAAQVRSLQLTVNKLVGSEPTPMPAGAHWQFQLDALDSSVAAIATNPAIEQASAEAEAAKLSAKSVRADGLPKVNWVINKNTASDVFGNRQPWSTMVQLSWTPFQGGSQRAAERAALARADSSSDKRDQLQLDSEYKVRDAHRDAIALATRAKLYSDLAVETDVIRKQFFEQWYHLNRRTLLDVLSAESDFYNNQVSAVTTQFDSYQAVLKIRLNNGTLGQWLQET